MLYSTITNEFFLQVIRWDLKITLPLEDLVNVDLPNGLVNNPCWSWRHIRLKYFKELLDHSILRADSNKSEYILYYGYTTARHEHFELLLLGALVRIVTYFSPLPCQRTPWVIKSESPKRVVSSRAVARSENLGGHVALGGDNVPPLVEIGLTDLPKTGGGAHAPPAPPLATGLSSVCHCVFIIVF